MTQHWFAVQTKPRQETRAEANLQNQGFQVYLPRLAVKKRLRQQWQNIIEPLFPSYLFIQLDPEQQSMSSIRSTFGVRQLVRFGQETVPVPDQVIQYLVEHDSTGKATDAPKLPFKKGDSVQIQNGPFAGLTAVYQMTKSADRAMLLLTLLGRCNTVAVNIHDIAPG